jgi:hypothetical protein
MKKPDEHTPLQHKSTMEEIEEAAEEAKEAKSWMERTIGDCCIFRLLAPISFATLENDRHEVLQDAHVFCLAGVVFAAIGFFGGFSWGTTLRYLAWMNITSPNGEAHAGVHWVCWDFHDPGSTSPGQISVNPENMPMLMQHRWECQTWEEFNCSQKADPASCQVCKSSAIGIAFSLFIAFVTYFGFKQKTDDRLEGRDSNFVKGVAVFSAFGGGLNFLVLVIGFYCSCFHMADNMHGVSVRPGIGFVCISISAVVKLLVGFLHLGLPVESSAKIKTLIL